MRPMEAKVGEEFRPELIRRIFAVDAKPFAHAWPGEVIYGYVVGELDLRGARQVP